MSMKNTSPGASPGRSKKPYKSNGYFIDNKEIYLGLIMLTSAVVVGFLVGLTMCKTIF